MRLPLFSLSASLLLLLAAPLPAAAAVGPQRIAQAVADPSRPATDVARDARRRPAATLAFIGIRPGDVIADYIANSGYFTRLFADLVGAHGHVYAVELNEIITYPNVAPGYAALKDWALSRPNVSVVTVPASQEVRFPRPLDVFWISQNYHDLHDKFLGPVDITRFNRQVYAALKPGGLYLVLDHAAAANSPPEVTETLHRIELATVKREVLAAGFELLAASPVLANPDDPHTAGVFNASIVGRTDQFLVKFRRPLRAPADSAQPHS
jgi:predicted methyltransferase